MVVRSRSGRHNPCLSHVKRETFRYEFETPAPRHIYQPKGRTTSKMVCGARTFILVFRTFKTNGVSRIERVLHVKAYYTQLTSLCWSGPCRYSESLMHDMVVFRFLVTENRFTLLITRLVVGLWVLDQQKNNRGSCPCQGLWNQNIGDLLRRH